MSGFTYLASPYSHPDPAVREERFKAVCRVAAFLMRKGAVIFSPIAHSHCVETIGMHAVESGEFWKRQDVPLLGHASELAVLMLDGWRESQGLRWEIAMAKSLRIPVVYVDYQAVRDWDQLGRAA